MKFFARETHVRFRLSAPGREVVALLCRQLTSTTLAEMSKRFGLNHPDRAANLIQTANQQIASSPKFKKNFNSIRERFLKTENQI